jgi:hypothetical protein
MSSQRSNSISAIDYEQVLSTLSKAEKVRVRSWVKQGIKFMNKEDLRYWLHEYNTATHCPVSKRPLYRNPEDPKGHLNPYAPVLEHSHKTGRPRGIVSRLANTMMGFAEVMSKDGSIDDSIDILGNATEFLMNGGVDRRY